jgi:N6-adenosine-specific RNA methylase IME4
MLPFHPLASIFPMMEGAEFDALVEDIKANGLREPATVFEGTIIDGRNRARACEKAGVDLKTEPLPPWDTANPRQFIISQNLHRRHLSASQISMVVASLALKPKGRPKKASNDAISEEQAAKKYGISEKHLQRAKHVRAHATPELIEAVEQDRISVDVAYKLASQPPEVQLKAVNEPDKAGHVEKQQRRADNEAALAKKIVGLPNKRYGVILADPEWRFIPWSEETGMDRSAANHYAASVLEQIKSRDVASISADDCVLFLWSTAPMLPQALEVLVAWGFEYKSHFVWLKNNVGTGYWTRSVHELLLIGTKGEVPGPAPGTQWESAWDADVAEHSRKPDQAYDLIEQYFPNLPKIELNARPPRREGWDVWGAEAPLDMGADCPNEPDAHGCPIEGDGDLIEVGDGHGLGLKT